MSEVLNIPDGEYDLDISSLLCDDSVNLGVRYNFKPDSIDMDYPLELVQGSSNYILKAESDPNVRKEPLVFEGTLGKTNQHDYLLIYDDITKRFQMDRFNGVLRMNKSRAPDRLLKKFEELKLGKGSPATGSAPFVPTANPTALRKVTPFKLETKVKPTKPLENRVHIHMKESKPKTSSFLTESLSKKKQDVHIRNVRPTPHTPSSILVSKADHPKVASKRPPYTPQESQEDNNDNDHNSEDEDDLTSFVGELEAEMGIETPPPPPRQEVGLGDIEISKSDKSTDQQSVIQLEPNNDSFHEDNWQPNYSDWESDLEEVPASNSINFFVDDDPKSREAEHQTTKLSPEFNNTSNSSVVRPISMKELATTTLSQSTKST
ncbi:BA75_00907T0 [Komagataella pastoris]|uniref:BA75_00907T0 n=1 Tax=Komagataella pastoris TaxID=4922 RepID=A0A1B2J8U8_PICPA|nr:BA75_00907T0 [Komagataella pastoris]